MGLRRETVEHTIKLIQQRLDQLGVAKPSDLPPEEQERLVSELKALLDQRRKSWRGYV